MNVSLRNSVNANAFEGIIKVADVSFGNYIGRNCIVLDNIYNKCCTLTVQCSCVPRLSLSVGWLLVVSAVSVMILASVGDVI